MALKVSTGLRNAILATGSFKSVMDNGFIRIYSGTPPTTANAAIGSAGSNTLLCEISVGGAGTGVTMSATPANGVLSKASAETWQGTVLASGVATFYRHVATGDDGALSETQSRLQGNVALANSEMNFTSTTLTAGATQNVDFYSVSFPTL